MMSAALLCDPARADSAFRRPVFLAARRGGAASSRPRRAPINLVMAAPAAGLRVVAAGARRLGAVHVASALGRHRLLLRTSVARRVEWLVCTELLELPCQVGDCVAIRDALAETIFADPHVLGTLRDMLTSIDPNEDDPLLRLRIQRALEEYTGTRGAAAEITTALLSLGTGAVTLGKLTPGVVSFGPTLASMVAQQARHPREAAVAGTTFFAGACRVIMAMVMISAPRRPNLSAYAPITRPPTGRMTKPTPKVAKLIRRDTTDRRMERMSGR